MKFKLHTCSRVAAGGLMLAASVFALAASAHETAKR